VDPVVSRAAASFFPREGAAVSLSSHWLSR
jgi:hypothetical protein